MTMPCGLKHVSVSDAKGRSQGIVTARPVLEVLLTEVEHEDKLLREYVICLGCR